jgi:hypothetical protein
VQRWNRHRLAVDPAVPGLGPARAALARTIAALERRALEEKTLNAFSNTVYVLRLCARGGAVRP